MDINELDLSILKTLITNRKYALEFVHESNEKLFDTKLWRFTKIVIDYIKTYHNVPTRRVLLERIKAQKNEVFLLHITEILDKLDAFVYDDKDYQFDLEKIKIRYSESLIAGLKENLANTNDVKRAMTEMNSVVSHINSINKVKAYEQSSLKDSIEDFTNRYKAKLKDPGFGAGIATGYGFLDFVTSGIRNSEMLLIGGATGSGKSMLLLNMAINMWLNGNTTDMEKDFKEGNDVLFFSLEMPHSDLVERSLARLAMISQKGIRDAKLEDNEKKSLVKALSFIKRYPNSFEIIDMARGASIDAIELVFNDITQKRGKPQVVVIDYMSLMDYTEEKLDDWLKLGKISGLLHEFARVHEIVMLSACQLNDGKTQGKAMENQIGLHRIARAKMVADNANFFIQIENRKNEEQLPDMSLHLIKSRRTELSRGLIHKQFSSCALLDEPANHYDQAKDPEDISNKLASFEEDKE